MEAESAEIALGIIADKTDIDLIFTDVVMPGGQSGPELADHVTKNGYTGKILYTSGFTEDAIPPDLLMAGRIALIQKPYTTRDLTLAIRSALGT